MSVNWTAEQTQVIESRNKNLLVSAAAGSGKTAVLVERIIRMVTDPDHPIDIDKLLVMTFTNAAAAEMRERVGAAIEQRLAKTPENEHLQIQAALVHHAQITTIDSFCLNLIRNHFNRLDLDPAFKIGDEGELTLLKADVMKEMLEDYYGQDDRRFEKFVETYAQGKSDAGIEDYIMQVYRFSQSNPYPEQWLAACRQELEVRGEDDLMQMSWMQFLMEDLKKQADELCLQASEALETCKEDEYLCAYVPMFEQDLKRLAAIGGAEDFEAVYEALSGISWDRLATVRSKEADPEKKAYVTGCRDRMKKAVAKMRELYSFAEPGEMLSDLNHTGEAVGMLLELAGEFSRRYQEKKHDRNMVDFNDMEHEALKVLTCFEDGRLRYTDVADELSAQYVEVLVDEYQDSNLVQETLLHAVSKERFGRPNVFMVGDVKQSIYKFRLARPELFLEKYDSYVPYGTADNGCQKIELHQNFRSRSQVLAGINAIFYRIMTRNLGNIRYTEDAALHPGARFAETDGHTAGIPELLVVDTGEASLQQLDDEAADYTSRELEAKLITMKIREMTDPEQGILVWDKKLNGTGGYRTAQYRDMVILLRSTAGWTETFLAVMMNEGIPAYAESRMGYFNTIEVETVLSFLAAIDNPMQDIPLAAVLRSPVAGASDVDLAVMMSYYRKCAKKGQDRGLYAAVSRYLDDWRTKVGTQELVTGETNLAAMDETGVDSAICEKLEGFMKLLTTLRQESTYLPIHELIYRVYERTGYYDYVSAMPAGETRRANLDMLVEKAAAYEKSSYKGLFHFIRYIENLKKYNTDFGEATTVGEEDHTVRIMSIHKSKGLEFPIVFLAGMGKKFNKQDVYGKILIDPELGIGTDYLDLENRLKTTTLKKNVLRRKMELDSLGEELRVLYVALSRAKEQLIMTGTDRYLRKSMEKFTQVPVVDGQVPYTILSTAGSYLDWMLMGMSGGCSQIRLTKVSVKDIVGEELIRQVKSRHSREGLLMLDCSQTYQEVFREELEDHLNYRYPYLADIQLHMKMSVSELKKQGQMVDEAGSVRQSGPLDETGHAARRESQAEGEGREKSGLREDPDSRQPRKQPDKSQADLFARIEQIFRMEDTGEQEVFSLQPFGDVAPDGGYGATRGTAYHRVMELLPFDRMGCLQDVERYLDEIVERKKMTEESCGLVDAADIWEFLQSDLGKRMSLAQKDGRLHKEQQFVMGIPAREMGAGDSDELIVIQGIIDAYLEEDGQLVVMDYKTDKVRCGETLVEHYKKQLDYYQYALEKMTGKTVKEKIIYSMTLQQEIGV